MDLAPWCFKWDWMGWVGIEQLSVLIKPPVSRQHPRVQAGQSKTDADESGDSYHCGAEDDEQHDVVAADVGGAGQEDGHDEDEGGGEHGRCVGEASKEVNHTLTKGEPMLVLNLMYPYLRYQLNSISC